MRFITQLQQPLGRTTCILWLRFLRNGIPSQNQTNSKRFRRRWPLQRSKITRTIIISDTFGTVQEHIYSAIAQSHYSKCSSMCRCKQKCKVFLAYFFTFFQLSSSQIHVFGIQNRFFLLLLLEIQTRHSNEQFQSFKTIPQLLQGNRLGVGKIYS